MTQRRKTKKKNYKTAIIVVLSLLFLGIISYNLKNRFVTPIGINEVTNVNGLIDLALSPASVSLSPGETTTLKILFHAGNYKIRGVTGDLSYNPADLEIISVTPSALFTLALEDATWAGGKISFGYNLPASHAGLGGDGEVATIVAKYKQGNPTLSFGTETIVVMVSETNEGNVLKTAKDTKFSPKSATSPSPSPSPSPSASARASSSPRASASPSPSASARASSSPRASASARASSSPRASASPSPSASARASSSPRASASPSPSPSASAAAEAPSKTTKAALSSDPTCNSLILKWDKITGAKGYYIDISKNSEFTAISTSGKLNSDRAEFMFSNLQKDTTYYARITQSEIHDFPKFGPVMQFKTAASCEVRQSPSPSPSPSATAKATATATPKATATATPKATATATPKATPTPTSEPTDEFGNTPRPPIDESVGDLSDLNQLLESDNGTVTETESAPNFFSKLFSAIADFFASLFGGNK